MVFFYVWYFVIRFDNCQKILQVFLQAYIKYLLSYQLFLEGCYILLVTIENFLSSFNGKQANDLELVCWNFSRKCIIQTFISNIFSSGKWFGALFLNIVGDTREYRMAVVFFQSLRNFCQSTIWNLNEFSKSTQKYGTY